MVALQVVKEPLACRREGCAFPEGGRCAREAEFPDPLALCEDLEREPSSVSEVDTGLHGSTGLEETQYRGPFDWTGEALSVAEAAQLASPRKVALLGHHDAGKTTLIASFFLAIASSGGAFPWRFAGSRTLPGLLRFAEAAASWRGHGDGQPILDHTPKGRPTQFLHLALRTQRLVDPRVLDLLISDVSGEDAEDFSRHQSEQHDKTMGFVRHADGFIVLVDCVRLFRLKPKQGEEIGPGYDGMISTMLGMVRSQLATRTDRSRVPVAMVWSKFDTVAPHVTPPALVTNTSTSDWGLLGRRAQRSLQQLRSIASDGVPVSVHAVSAFPAAVAHAASFNVTAPFDALVAHNFAGVAQRRLSQGAEGSDHPFLTLRRMEDT